MDNIFYIKQCNNSLEKGLENVYFICLYSFYYESVFNYSTINLFTKGNLQMKEQESLSGSVSINFGDIRTKMTQRIRALAHIYELRFYVGRVKKKEEFYVFVDIFAHLKYRDPLIQQQLAQDIAGIGVDFHILATIFIWSKPNHMSIIVSRGLFNRYCMHHQRLVKLMMQIRFKPKLDKVECKPKTKKTVRKGKEHV